MIKLLLTVLFPLGMTQVANFSNYIVETGDILQILK